MRRMQSINVTLPTDVAEMISEKIASGKYVDEGDVIRDGLRALQCHDATIAEWLHESVAPVYDAHVRDPSRAMPADEVLARLERRWAREVSVGGRDAYGSLPPGRAGRPR